ncbi:zinc metalloproteinase-disintegrin-like MTP9 [Leptodactylus fuscus]|uniref:zinc metalloproteinase-disintegrin-like MTP9 n=1 Tax=Leptodactylus fuscus TaxID=238119 RepID=UPI003F4EBF13
MEINRGHRIQHRIWKPSEDMETNRGYGNQQRTWKPLEDVETNMCPLQCPEMVNMKWWFLSCGILSTRCKARSFIEMFLRLLKNNSKRFIHFYTTKFMSKSRLNTYNAEPYFSRLLPFPLDKYPSLVQYEIQLKGELVVILLEKTENLLSDDYIETLYRHDDTPVMITSEDQIQDHCHYQGYVKDDEGSAVSISTCSGVSGVILTQDRKFFIEPLNPSDNGKHAIYEAVEDIPNTMGAMISEDTLPDVKADQMAQMLTREDDDILSSQKYIELYMVADNSMFVAYNRNTSLIKNKLIQIVNYINLAYKTLNIFVALIGLEIWNTKNQIEVTLSIEDNLDRFAKWRQKILLSRIKHDNAQLISHIHFNGTRAGLAYTGSMCSDTHSVGVMQDYSTFASTVAATLAHEMGHNLGMNHDNSNCTCSEKACIMTATVSNKFLDYFSSCSVKQLRTFFSKLDPNCLLNKPNSKNIVSPAVCGNQFTELGEECDCGTEQIKEAGAVCRPSSGIDCDLPATCDGSSIHCPNNNWKENGVPCKNGQGYCYNGQCHTLEKQCIKLWGPGDAHSLLKLQLQ